MFAAILALLPETSLAQIPGATLREQLKSLERLHGVEVRGLERIGDEPARPTAAGDLRGQVMNLLRNYNYVVMQSSADQVRGVRILPSQRRGGPDVRPRISALGVQAVAQGKPPLDGQAVHVSLLGLGGREYEMTLAIDLAAKAVVLPAAMKAALGFEGAELLDGAASTSAGRVRAEIGQLPAVRLGTIAAENVDVAFVADDAIGGRALLGESVLKHFNVSYDEERLSSSSRPNNHGGAGPAGARSGRQPRPFALLPPLWPC
ncbi:MAG: aspartyl protease family protein [Rhodospirillales bacterium]